MDSETLKMQEEKTFDKTKQYLLKEQDSLRNEIEKWNVSLEEETG